MLSVKSICHLIAKTACRLTNYSHSAELRQFYADDLHEHQVTVSYEPMPINADEHTCISIHTANNN